MGVDLLPAGDKLRFLPLQFFLLAVLLRLPFTSKLLFHHDSVNFALALDRYDLRHHQPHPPGYFLYVMLGRVVHLFVPDANTALVVIGLLSTSLAVTAIYFLARDMYDLPTAVVAALLAAFSPNLWFHGEVALSYGTEAFFSAMLGLLCWRIRQGREDLLLLSAAFLAVAGGFRQSTLVFLFPLWLCSVWRLPPRRIAAALALLAVVCSLWFVAMVRMTGGIPQYASAFKELWEFNTGHNSVFEKGWESFRRFGCSLLDFNLLGLCGAVPVMGAAGYGLLRDGRLGCACRGKRWFYLAWILPPLLFYQLVFIHPANTGYALIFLPPLLILAARSVLFVGRSLQRICCLNCTTWLLLCVLVANTVFFLFSDSFASWRLIRRHDRDLELILRQMRSADPGTTAIVSRPGIFFGFRMLMYYLPDYTVYNTENRKAVAAGVPQTFWGVGRRTFLADRIVLPPSISRVATIRFSRSGSDECREVEGGGGTWICIGPADEMLGSGLQQGP